MGLASSIVNMDSTHYIKDLTTDNITRNVIAINSQCPEPRFRLLLERLVTYLHDFARETQLTTSEWEATIKFLTEVGDACTEFRSEFVLLSDVLGLSLLMDSINHPRPSSNNELGGSLVPTEGTVLGPFHTHDAAHLAHGGLISHDEDGEPLLVVGTVRDTEGRPIAGAQIDVWENNSHGLYDVQYPDRDAPDGRGILKSDEQGNFFFRAVVPVPYSIPNDGPVGRLLDQLKRHPMRPSHFHFMIFKPGYDRLVTALYRRGDPYERSDAVFGVKESLVVDIGPVGDVEGFSAKYGVSPETKLMRYDFVLMSEKQMRELQEQKAKEAKRT
ncbi:unnamed protein product [Clonostachys rosea]|uniref:Intradiol ring-cleavage dioxygenases domain-containing protein n=1 Tax=Bionectria ochroleuca TaxID=29856 RepID=A0ABY6V0U9_BIOOC|nr:unnamed protein product [Clonostachys rosea]